MADLVTATQDACAAALARLGFAQKRRGILLQPGPTKAVTGWLGLNLARWDMPAVLHVNPVVGVRHLPLEQALVELDGRKAPVPCAVRPLGYLTPQNSFVQWDFGADTDLSKTAESLAESVTMYGQPFIDKWSDWRTFSEEIADSGLLLDTEKFIVLPVVAALNGDRSRADSLLQAELERVGDKPDAYSQGYRAFAQGFAAKSFNLVA